MLLVSDDFILDLESMNHKLTNTMLWPSKYIRLIYLKLQAVIITLGSDVLSCLRLNVIKKFLDPMHHELSQRNTAWG